VPADATSYRRDTRPSDEEPGTLPPAAGTSRADALPAIDRRLTGLVEGPSEQPLLRAPGEDIVTTQLTPTATTTPISSLTADEITRIRQLLHEARLVTETTRFVYVGLLEPSKGEVLASFDGGPIPATGAVLASVRGLHPWLVGQFQP